MSIPQMSIPPPPSKYQPNIDDLIDKSAQEWFEVALKNWDIGYNNSTDKQILYISALFQSNIALYLKLEELVDLLKE